MTTYDLHRTDGYLIPQPVAVCAREPLPDRTAKSIFLAGPTPRDKQVPSWRPEAFRILHELGYDGYVFIPEDRDGGYPKDQWEKQVEWETAALNMADIIVFWVPRDMATMPALTTNIEWGAWANSGKAVLGTPDSASKMQYMKWQAGKYKVPVFDNLLITLSHAVKEIGEGAFREGGAAQVPINVWKHPTFQAWYRSQLRAGNRLDSARVLWTFRVGPELKKVFAWAVHVNVYIADEGRNKTIEFVIGRGDIAAVVLYYVGSHRDRETDIMVVLVREFRSPARTKTGYITELPAGGVEGKDPKEAALKELKEETGVTLDASRLRPIGTHQLAGTLSAHASTVFAAEITQDELDDIERRVGTVFGEDSEERTSIVIDTLTNLLQGSNHDVDWSTLGMISAAVLNPQ